MRSAPVCREDRGTVSPTSVSGGGGETNRSVSEWVTRPRRLHDPVTVHHALTARQVPPGCSTRSFENWSTSAVSWSPDLGRLTATGSRFPIRHHRRMANGKWLPILRGHGDSRAARLGDVGAHASDSARIRCGPQARRQQPNTSQSADRCEPLAAPRQQRAVRPAAPTIVRAFSVTSRQFTQTATCVRDHDSAPSPPTRGETVPNQDHGTSPSFYHPSFCRRECV
jgi:hypothetical protein